MGRRTPLPALTSTGLRRATSSSRQDPGGSFSTAVPNPNPYDGSDDNLVGIINNSGSTITSLSFVGSGIGGGLFAFDGDGLSLTSQLTRCDPTGYGGRVSTTANFNTSGPRRLIHRHPHRPLCSTTAEPSSSVRTEFPMEALRTSLWRRRRASISPGEPNPGARQPRPPRRRARRSRSGAPPPEARLNRCTFLYGRLMFSRPSLFFAQRRLAERRRTTASFIERTLHPGVSPEQGEVDRSPTKVTVTLRISRGPLFCEAARAGRPDGRDF